MFLLHIHRHANVLQCSTAPNAYGPGLWSVLVAPTFAFNYGGMDVSTLRGWCCTAGVRAYTTTILQALLPPPGFDVYMRDGLNPSRFSSLYGDARRLWCVFREHAGPMSQTRLLQRIGKLEHILRFSAKVGAGGRQPVTSFLFVLTRIARCV